MGFGPTPNTAGKGEKLLPAGLLGPLTIIEDY